MKIEITDRELLAIMVGESDPTFYKLQNKMMDIIVECMEQTNAEIRRLKEALKGYSSKSSTEVKLCTCGEESCEGAKI